MQRHKRDVVITGMGAISALGLGVKAFSRGLRHGSCGILFSSSCGAEETPSPLKMGAFLPPLSLDLWESGVMNIPENLRRKVSQLGRRTPFTLQAAIFTGVECWINAHLIEHPLAPEKIGLVVGGQNIGQGFHYQTQQSFFKEPEYLSPRYAVEFMDTHHVGVLSETFGIKGEGFTVGGASASGTMAIIRGVQLIQQGLVEGCLVVGATANLSPVEWQAFQSLGALGGRSYSEMPERACRPFDQKAEGFIYGQGSGSLFLETRESAHKRGATVLGEVVGAASCLDANHTSDPSVEGEIRCMELALQRTNLKSSQINYINAHGTSTPLGDKTEIQAIKTVFRENLKDIWINSSKSLIGHCLWSAGVMEAIATLIQMQEEFVHPNLNLENPIDSECRLAGKESTPACLEYALSNSFGFGGINTSIILKKGER